ncbi:MAG TPA: inorganic diphosphatase, partial [Blastocatellia bacterium]|nr:inorganic diphosphatase [Blastocatellia bacterium]
FDFGFIPSTLGGDGDPLDVLILMEEPAFPGCVVSARLIGVIEANQTDGEGTERNDRLIAVAAEFHTHSEVRAISDLSENLIDEIEHFFISYHQIRGKQFEPLGRFGPDRAEAIVKEGMKNFRKARRQSKKSDRRKKSRKG